MTTPEQVAAIIAEENDPSCDPDCNYIEWSNVVGLETVDDKGVPIFVGGGVNDLLYIARQHLASAKSQGQLTAEEMGKAYASVIPAAFREAINFELAESLRENEIAKAKAEVKLAEMRPAFDFLSAQLGAWTSAYTSGKLDNRPDILENEEIECLYDNILKDITDEGEDDCVNPTPNPTEAPTVEPYPGN